MSGSQPGPIVLLGSGETAPSMQKVYHHVFSLLEERPRVAILETPAGFEPNSAEVAAAIGRYLRKRLQNFQPQVVTVPARRATGSHSTNDRELLAPLYAANVMLTGPGSPTYAVRHLRGSVCWDVMRIGHRLGRTLFLSSAATVAIGHLALPVYEIYKVGMDLHWQPGLDLLADFGLMLTVIPHWNNRSGGQSLDTRRCYMGRERFERLRAMLPSQLDLTVLGIDENTAAVLLPASGQCQVLGQGAVTLLRGEDQEVFPPGSSFALSRLGPWAPPAAGQGLDAAVWRDVEQRMSQAMQAQEEDVVPSDEVREWLRQRAAARDAKDWSRSDQLRDRIQACGWIVQDTAQGQKLERG